MNKLLVAVATLALAGTVLAEDAHTLFASKCAVCHGKDGKGSPAGLKMGAKDLSQTKLSEADIAKTVENGKGKMTPFKGKLTPEQIEAVAKYIKGGLK
jgi:cytochrome c6